MIFCGIDLVDFLEILSKGTSSGHQIGWNSGLPHKLRVFPNKFKHISLIVLVTMLMILLVSILGKFIVIVHIYYNNKCN